MVHVADWYATLSLLVGIDPQDKFDGVHDVDSVNVWPMLMGANVTNPREYLPINHGADTALEGSLEVHQ